MCKVDGCNKPIRYSGLQLCQMHYFRMMRYGTYELTRKAPRERFVRDDGYVIVRAVGHHMAYQNYVYEHRKVAYEKYGEVLPACEFCNLFLDWNNCVIDHIDENKQNNHPDNLRPLCMQCNVKRTKTLAINRPNAIRVTIGDVTQTPEEWARQVGNIRGNTIRRRLLAGCSPEEAVYGPKKTHNGNISVDKRPRKTNHLHERGNAVNIEIEGVKMTCSEWAKHNECEVSGTTLRNRVRDGWPQDKRILKRIYSSSK